MFVYTIRYIQNCKYIYVYIYINVYVLYTVEVKTYRVLVSRVWILWFVKDFLDFLSKRGWIRRKLHMGWLIIMIPQLLDIYGYLGSSTPMAVDPSWEDTERCLCSDGRQMSSKRQLELCSGRMVSFSQQSHDRTSVLRVAKGNPRRLGNDRWILFTEPEMERWFRICPWFFMNMCIYILMLFDLLDL